MGEELLDNSFLLCTKTDTNTISWLEMSLSNSMMPLLGIADRVDLHLVFEWLRVFIMNIIVLLASGKKGGSETLKRLFLILIPTRWLQVTLCLEILGTVLYFYLTKKIFNYFFSISFLPFYSVTYSISFPIHYLLKKIQCA